VDQEVADSGGRARSRRALVPWISRFAARGGLALLAFTAIYLAATSILAARRPLWNDEIYTYDFAQTSGVGGLWRALESGADQAPPLSYLLTRASVGAFGVSRLTIRLPEVVAFLVFCVCAYLFVARRTNCTYGLVAMFLPALTAAYYYASEARAYAFVLAFGALALVCWQLATEGVRRPITVVGLALSLALATSSHYYAVLLLVPLGLGELTRTLAARRIDPPVWIAFSGALLPFIALIQLVRAARGYSADFWGRPSWSDAPKFFSFLFDTRSSVRGVQLGQVGRPTIWWLALLALGVLMLALVVLSPGAELLRRRPRARIAFLGATAGLALLGVVAAATVPGIPVSPVAVAVAGLVVLTFGGYVVRRLAWGTPPLAGPPGHEVVAVGAFLLLPLAAVVLAKTVTNAYTDRYALPTVIGLAVLPLALYRLEGRRPRVGQGIAAALAVAFVVAFVLHEQNASRLAADQVRTLHFLEQNTGSGTSILVDNPHQFLELEHAAPPSLARRLIYVADPQWDSTQRGLLVLGQIASLRVYDRKYVAALPGHLIAFSSRREADWSDTRNWTIMRMLKAEGRTITERSVYGNRALYEISGST
jgi:4-amino-4-deoxy-L-arabinose transferase-like glycosyltransferase